MPVGAPPVAQRSAGGPLDGRRSYSSTTWLSLAVGKTESSHQKPGMLSGMEHGRLDVTEHQLRASEHGELAVSADRPPREVDEALPGSPLDVRSCDVQTGKGRCHRAIQVPIRPPCVTWLHLQQLSWAATALNADVDVLVAGEAGTGAAVSPGRSVASIRILTSS